MNDTGDSALYTTRSRALLENAGDLMAVIDGEGYLRYINPSVTRILGYAPDELIGRALKELVHPDDVGTFREALGRGYATEEERESLGTADDLFFLHKPWTIEDLGRTVREALDHQP